MHGDTAHYDSYITIGTHLVYNAGRPSVKKPPVRESLFSLGPSLGRSLAHGYKTHGTEKPPPSGRKPFLLTFPSNLSF